MSDNKEQQWGRISQIIGPVVDVAFEANGKPLEEVLPKIHEALSVKNNAPKHRCNYSDGDSYNHIFAVHTPYPPNISHLARYN